MQNNTKFKIEKIMAYIFTQIFAQNSLPKNLNKIFKKSKKEKQRKMENLNLKMINITAKISQPANSMSP